MKALLVCLSAIILQAGSCNNEGDETNCPPCPECPVCPPGGDDGRVLAEMPHAKAMIDQYKTPATRYTAVSQMTMNIDDLQTLINMARREGKSNVHVFLGSFTRDAAREYLTGVNENVDQYLDTVIGRPIVMMGTGPGRVYGVKTMICPPPATCGMEDR